MPILGYCSDAEDDGGKVMKCKTCGCELEPDAYRTGDYICGNGCNDYPILLKVSVAIQVVFALLIFGFALILKGFIVIFEKLWDIKDRLSDVHKSS